MSIIDLRPRSPTELVDATVQLVRSHYSLLVAGGGLFVLPGVALKLFVPERLTIVPRLLVGFVVVVGAWFGYAMIIRLAAQLLVGGDSTVHGALRAVRALGVEIFVGELMQGLLVGLGTLLIVPGIIWFVRTFVMQVAILVERLGPADAWDRSIALSRERFGHIVGAMGLGYVIYWGFYFGIGIVLDRVGEVAHLAAPLVGVARALLALLLMPFFGVLMTLLYYDLRIRREGLDLELMVSALESAPTVATP